MSRFALILVIITCSAIVASSNPADGFVCGCETAPSGRSAPLIADYRFDPAGDRVNVLMVFIGYAADDSAGVWDPILEDFHGRCIEVLATYVERLTYGKLVVDRTEPLGSRNSLAGRT